MRKTAAVLGVAVTAFACSLFLMYDDDVGFHVANGRLVRQAWTEGTAIPTRNPFTYAEPDAPWLQHQEIPAAGISWLVDDAPALLGIPADPTHPDVRVLIVVKALAFAALFALLARATLAERVPASTAALLCCLAIAATAPRFFERPYLLSAFGLAAVAISLRRFAASGRRAWLAVAALVPVLNAHLHSGVWDSILCWCAFLAGLAGDRLRDRIGWRSGQVTAPTGKEVAWTTGAFVACLALMAATLAAWAPSGLGVLELPLHMTGSGYWHEHVKEFRPLYEGLAVLWPAAIFLCVLWALVALRSWELPSADVLLAVGFGVLALRHQRMVLPLVIVTLPVIGRATASAMDAWKERVPTATRRRLSFLASASAVVLAVTAFVCQSEAFRMGPGDSGNRGLDPRGHPFGLMNRLDVDGLPGEVFVSDGLAGTFLWRFYPQRRVCVHNDLEAYSEAVYRDVYQSIRYAEPGFEDKLRRLGVRSFLLKHSTPGERAFLGGRPGLRDRLWARSGSGEYPDAVLVDFDDAAALWVLRDALPPGVSTLDGFPVDPDTGRLRPGVERGRVVEALLRHAKAHEGARRSLEMADSLIRNSPLP
jgi:hypothetical protein